MSISSLLAPLSRVGLFRSLTPFQLSEVARRAEQVTYHSGEVVIAAGEEPDGALLILDGVVARIESDQKLVEIHAGALLSEMAAVVDIEAAYTIVAKGEVRALKITRLQMLEQLEEDPSLGERLLATIAGRLADLARDLKRIERLFPDPGEAAADIACPQTAAATTGAEAVRPTGALMRDHQTAALVVQH